jgi:TonB family protein
MEQYSAAVVWERYGVSEHGVSVLMPKLPTRIDPLHQRSEERRVSYFAYAEGAIYELTIVAEREAAPAGITCDHVDGFNAASAMKKRIGKLNESGKGSVVDRGTFKGLDVYNVTANDSTRWLIADMKQNRRWLELAVHHYPDEKPKIDTFLGSIEFSGTNGKEIGRGADSTLGDPPPKPEGTASPSPSLPVEARSGSGNGGVATPRTGVAPTAAVPITNSLKIINQPPARYTDAAREANVEGPVRVRITLHANGGVGSVVAVTSLSHGLTEQVLEAARHIVFLPKRVNKQPVSVAITREYSFTIY